MSLESSQLFILEANWWTSSVTEVDYMYTPQPFSEAITLTVLHAVVLFSDKPGNDVFLYL